LTDQIHGDTFGHDAFTKELCPEASGHFCMLWGEHGHGGYDSLVKGYIQGGQPMDDTFGLIAAYLDFKEANEIGDWSGMRQAVSELREIRTTMNVSQAEERAMRYE
jgi:hypothetical protein